MGARVVSEAIRRGIVARIVSGKSTAAQEAKKYGQKPATVRGWVHEDKEKVISEMKPTTTPTTTPSTTTPTNPVVAPPVKEVSGATPARDEAAIARARASMGLPPTEGNPSSAAARPIVAGDLEAALAAADEDDKRVVLEFYTEGKKGLVEIIARRSNLDPTDPLVKAAATPSSLTKLVLTTNAGLIAPIIRGKLVGWPAVAGVLIFDAALTFMTIRDIAVALGKIKPAPAPGQSPTAPRPTPPPQGGPSLN